MTPHQMIHDLWAGSSALVALLPVEKLKTGLGEEDTSGELPYAVLSLVNDFVVARSNSAKTREAELRIQIWTATHLAGRQIAEAIEDELDNVDGISGGRLGSQFLRVSSIGELQEEDGVWQHVVSCQLRYQTSL
jgi:hypothetical protein